MKHCSRCGSFINQDKCMRYIVADILEYQAPIIFDQHTKAGKAAISLTLERADFIRNLYATGFYCPNIEK